MLMEISRLGRRSLKTAAAPVYRGLSVGRGLFDRFSGGRARVLILGYHHVVDDIDEAERLADPGMVVSTDSFRRHLQLICDNCEVVSMDEVVRIVRGERAIGHTVAAITFDDGYRDFLENAWPLLRVLRLPVTIYLPYAAIGAGRMLDHDRLSLLVASALRHGLSLSVPLTRAGLAEEEIDSLTERDDTFATARRLNDLPLARRELVCRSLEEFVGTGMGADTGPLALLDWDSITDLVREGVTIGAHTINHAVLPLEDGPTARFEVAHGKTLLEGRLGEAVRHFAYPTGRHDETTRRVVQRACFDSAVTTEALVNRPGANPLALGRICLSEESTRDIRGRYSDAVARLRLLI